MKILLLSAGGGGGNILRSVRALFDQDVEAVRQSDPDYAQRLHAAVTTRYLDTNAFSLSDVPDQERLLIGPRTTGRLGARHDPQLARQAFEESKADVEAVIAAHSAVILIGTGGKGTGAGTMLPLALMAREQKKLVLPIFVRPSFERHEVDKRRYDHALHVCQQLDAAGVRLIEILNDRGYDERAPRPQEMVWEQMNVPIARGLRGLIYVLWDLSQVDPSDLSMLLAGNGRLRIGFGEVEGSAAADPTDDQIEEAVKSCWDNPYYAFNGLPGTSLICIQGEWSNIADAKIKSRLAARASAGSTDSPYVPLYTRAVRAPRPWGVTTLFGEHTGAHEALDVDWSFASGAGVSRIPVPGLAIEGTAVQETVRIASFPAQRGRLPDQVVREPAKSADPEPRVAVPAPQEGDRVVKTPATLWELAAAVNRCDPSALAIAQNGSASEIPVEGPEVRRLLAAMWFRAIVPRLSPQWRARMLDALVSGVVVPNHVVKIGRHMRCLSELTYAQLQELVANSWMPDAARVDLEFLVSVGRLWGADAVGRLQFSPALQPPSSRLTALLEGIRR